MVAGRPVLDQGDLRRVRSALRRMLLLQQPQPHPHPQPPPLIVHVVGTNAKGSVATAAATALAIAAAPDAPTGLFLSPHLIAPRDAWQLRHADGSATIVEQPEYDSLCATAAALDPSLTAFEVDFVSCMTWLVARRRARAIVVEAGMGGRLDATNVFHDNHDGDSDGDGCFAHVIVVTPIDMDHAAVFNAGSPCDIAREKCGVIHDPRSAVVIARQPHDAVRLLVARIASDIGCTCVVNAADAFAATSGADVAQENFNLGLLVAQVATRQQSIQGGGGGGARIARHHHHRLASPILPGRRATLRLFGAHTECLVDGAHNAHALASLRAHIVAARAPPAREIIHVLAMTSSRDPRALMPHLLPAPGAQVIAVGFDAPQSMPWIRCVDPREMADALASATGARVLACAERISDLAETGLLQRHHQNALVVVTGSLYLVADAYRLHMRQCSNSSNSIEDLFKISLESST